jgi:hypothetical protein
MRHYSSGRQCFADVGQRDLFTRDTGANQFFPQRPAGDVLVNDGGVADDAGSNNDRSP